MNTQILNKKLELIQWLSTLEDKSIIEKLLKFRQEETKDWWESISDEEKKSIETGISEADNDDLKPHSEAKKNFMKSGYNIVWTPNALSELTKTIEYLERNFSEKEIKKLADKIESTVALISKNPNLFPISENRNIHKAVLLKYNSMYYRVKNENIEILSFFSNRQSPDKRKT